MTETKIVFKRKLYEKMLEWKTSRNGETALLIKGARRVGKSTLARQFAQNEYKTSIIIDFSVARKEVVELFDDISDLNFIFLKLQLYYNVKLENRNSVIVFDEIQLVPKARQAIKHLVADGRYDYIETGSLLSIRKNVKDIIIPSEETRINMYPMDFEEFRWALGDNVTFDLLRQAYEARMSLGDGVNRKLMRDFRLYMLVGGMPQAVSSYIKSNDFKTVDKVKREIIELYESDLRKIDTSGRASMIFDAIPAQLNSNASRYQVSSVIENSKASRIEEIIADLQNSMTVNVSFHTNDPNAGMSFSKDFHRYKIFLADTGLFVTLAFKDKSFTDNDIYARLLNDKLSANLGYLYENVVSQMLKARGYELFYHTFSKKDSTKKYEIDFLISHKNKVCPIEVKSSGYNTHASIDEFSVRRKGQIFNKYIVYTKDFRIDNDFVYLPFYMLSLL